MNVFLWVAALRIVAGALIVSFIWPNFVQSWRRSQAHTRSILR